MGKHSRRKGKITSKSVDDKKAHKERQKERRQRTIEALDQQNGTDDDDNNSETDGSGGGGQKLDNIIEVGDRVRYAQSVNQVEWKWGVIKAIMDRDETNKEDPMLQTFSVLPWQAAEDRPESLVTIRQSMSIDINGQDKRIFRLIEKREGFWTLRFSHGDQVYCQRPSTFHDRHPPGWIGATVDRVWPRWYDEEKFDEAPVECYRCTDNQTGDFIFVMNDRDEFITAVEDTKLRFAKGDRVIFKTKTERWVEGTVVGTIVGGDEDFCAGYSVRLAKGGGIGTSRAPIRYVSKDTDEWIARADTGPRQRLFDAIDQNCSYVHLNHLVTSTNLDVSSFRDLIISRAIQACSYDALAWIQDTMKVDLSNIHDADGNSLLHQISALPNATRFFEKAANILGVDDPGRIAMHSSGMGGLIPQLDGRGRCFLHRLVTAGNIHSLDLALMSDGQFAWDLALVLHIRSMKDDSSSIAVLPSVYTVTRDEKGTNVRDAAKLLGRHDFVKMIDDYAMWQTAYELASGLQFRPDFAQIKAKTLPKFAGISNVSVIRKLRHFLSSKNTKRHFASLEHICRNIVSDGNLPVLSWLVEGEPALLQVSTTEETTTANMNEFAQPELVDIALERGLCESMGLVSLAAHGKPCHYFTTAEAREFYANEVLSGFLLGSPRSGGLKAYIEKEMGTRSRYLRMKYDFQKILDYKVRLLSDDEVLSQRLETLDYLCKENGQPLPNSLDIIRWRQCGVLRWMVSESFVDLTRPVVDDPSTVRNAEKVHFLGGGALPKSVSVGLFLCFAAVEYDDLQSFEWLISEQNISVMISRCNGWNLLHTCAYFGRTEIAHWILHRVIHSDGLTAANQFLSEPCDREESRNMYAAHIAVRQGFIQLADFLLKFGCPHQDKNGKPVYFYAKSSSYEFVKRWGERNEQSMQAISRLEQDIKALYRLLASPDDSDNIAEAMAHISKSRCLDHARWTDLELGLSNTGPFGKSYRDVLKDCCTTGITDFIIWLCHTLTPNWSYKYDMSMFRFHQFWDFHDYVDNRSGQMEHKALLTLALERNNSRLAVCLGKKWTREIRCHDPSEANPLFTEIMRHHGENVSVATGMMKLRDSMVLDELSLRVLSFGSDEVLRLLARTAPLDTITEVLNCMHEVAKDVDDSLIPDFNRWMCSADAAVDVGCHLPCDYSDDNPLKDYSLFVDRLPAISVAYIVFVVENCEELIRWSLEKRGWNTAKELKAIRIAAYLEHQNIVDVFLQNYGELPLSSALSERREAALLGALEGGFVEEIENRGLLPSSRQLPSSWQLPSSRQSEFSNFENVIPTFSADGEWEGENPRDMLDSSLVGVAVFGCLVGCKALASKSLGTDHALTAKNIKALKWVSINTGIETIVFLRAAVLVHRDIPAFFNYFKFVDLFKHLVGNFSLNPFCCQKETSYFTETIATHFQWNQKNELLDDSILQEWLALLVNLGLDIQSVRDAHCGGSDGRHESFLQVLRPLQAEQRRAWSKFDVVRKGGSLETIQQSVVSGDLDLASYDSNGLKLVHVVSAFDRVDVLEWLVETYPLQLDEVDGSGRSVLKVAIASNASSASHWISRKKAMQRISWFVVSSIRRRHAVEEVKARLRHVTAMQAWCRAYLVRRFYRGRLLSRLQETQRFHARWGNVLSMVEKDGLLDGETSWGAIKSNRFDLLGSMDENDEFSPEDRQESSKKLASATSLAVLAQHYESATDATDNIDKIDQHLSGVESSVTGVDSQLSTGFDRILLTRAVLRWRRQADPKYLDIFVERIKQLAAGDRSLLLQKSLTGCKTIIYESKLDAGQRILWTETRRGLIVWYVLKHDDVSRYVRLMDKAESRSNRQMTTASNLPELDEKLLTYGASKEVILDPQGDTPLRLYNIRREDIYKLGESSLWQPPLHLTSKERQVVETQGTVLLLGRSGTGKTICICNRIDCDRHRADGVSSFKQLFVARSKRICTMVEDVVGKDTSTTFLTFKRLLLDCETELPATIDGSHAAFLPSKKMNYARFKRDVCHLGSPLDALLLWTQIRSLIKGSIANLDRPRSREEYMSLGKNECRLTQEQRSSCYSVFESYERYMSECKLWDDCDRMTSLLRQLQTDPDARFAMSYDKVYVDEIQDYTQIELALFFMLCRHHSDLFLAGDPAQSVVEGSDFRFEDIRTVAHHLFQNDKSGRKGIPDKPLKLNVNFRSHSGILNVASGVLDMLFAAFPGSAKELPKDKGLFIGPRPGVFMNVESSKLKELLSRIDGAFVLTHDEEMSRLKRCLGDYELILGIRDSKGLEFKDVVLVDFFKGLAEEHQKPWRSLLQGKNEIDLKPGFPEIESHLKLLYTAVTRVSGRLFIAETGSSIAGQAFVRWATSRTKSGGDALAVKQEVHDVEKMVRTPDEWRSNGVDFAMVAEGMYDDLDEAHRWLDKAIYCFAQVGDDELARKARTNRASVRFREQLEERNHHHLGNPHLDSAAKIEIDAAEMLERLLAEHLAVEARKVLNMILPLLDESSSTILRRKLLAKLPAEDDE